MNKIKISSKYVGADCPVYIIAEVSANHNQKFDQAIKIIHAAKESGADAIKLQTYTADTITINCNNEYFKIGKGSIWEGRNLYELYTEACTPWEWQPKLKAIANDLGMDLFSTPFDTTAVDFLDEMDVPAYKVASFELVDLPLLSYIAKKKKPIIMSTGMATLAEIDEAVRAIRDVGGSDLILLKCTSAYPALPEEMNLKTIAHLSSAFDVPSGLSDHTLGITVPVLSVAFGACIIEKHLTMSMSVHGPDSAFSMEPQEFKAMVDAVRTAERAIGEVKYSVTENEIASRVFRRSLFIVKDIKKGEVLTGENVRSIRPGHGLSPKLMSVVIGKCAVRDIERGTPLNWDMLIEGTS